MADFAGQKKRVVVLGGGFGGAYCAQSLCKASNRRDFEITFIDRNNFLLFYPLLVEAGVGILEPRHVVAPLRKFLQRGDFRMAEVKSVDLKTRQISFRVIGRDDLESIHYDHLVLSLGSITKVPPIPGLREHGFELKSLGDAIEMRDRGIRLLELANTIPDREKRRELLTVVVVGANFTGIELAGEYHAFLHEAIKAYPMLSADEIRMVVLEYADRILLATTEKLAKWCHETLAKRGVEIHTKSTITEVGENYCITSYGERIPTRTVVWAAGIAPNPLLEKIEGLPRNKPGYIECEPDLRVKGFENVWAIGDCATVMSPEGKPYAATAQNATRQGTLCAQNIISAMEGGGTHPFSYTPLGSFAAIGHQQATAEVLGMQFTGFLGWFLYRSTYLFKMPTWGLKFRLMADWTISLLFKNEPVQLGVHRPLPPAPEEVEDPGDPARTTAEIPRAYVK